MGEGWGEGALAGYQYTYDAASRIDTITSMLDGLADYGYDHTNQLTSADYTLLEPGLPTEPIDESYSYDPNGNRTMTGYETGQNNLIQSDGTYSYIYDAEGNRVRKTEIATGKYTVYQYDHRNRLVRVEDIDPTQGYLEDWGWGNSNASYTYEESHEEPDPLGESQAYIDIEHEFSWSQLWARVYWVTIESNSRRPRTRRRFHQQSNMMSMAAQFGPKTQPARSAASFIGRAATPARTPLPLACIPAHSSRMKLRKTANPRPFSTFTVTKTTTRLLWTIPARSGTPIGPFGPRNSRPGPPTTITSPISPATAS